MGSCTISTAVAVLTHRWCRSCGTRLLYRAGVGMFGGLTFCTMFHNTGVYHMLQHAVTCCIRHMRRASRAGSFFTPHARLPRRKTRRTLIGEYLSPTHPSHHGYSIEHRSQLRRRERDRAELV
jgi:hypothetical protein